MDPPHMTEFASERYFEKLKQLSESRDQTHDGASHSQDGPTVTHPPTFILPTHFLHDTQKTEKRRLLFGGFRPHKSTSRSSVEQEPRRLSGESTRAKSTPFDQLFLALPSELQIQIIADLPLCDILNLRLASRSWHAMITVNELPIARYHLKNHIPAYAIRLYPAPDPSAIRLHYICGIWHRLHVAAKVSYLICERVTKEIFLRTTEAQRLEFSPQHERMRRRLIPLLFTIFHFFETYRRLHLEYIQEHGHGIKKMPHTLNPIELKVMDMYDDQTLLRVHQVFPLVVSSYRRRLRPPSYVGRFEQALRGYLKDPPSDEVHAAALCMGGLRQVEKFWEVKGYNQRTSAVDDWYDLITKGQIETAKPQRRGFMSFGRRKPTMNVYETKQGTDYTGGNRKRQGSDASMGTFQPGSILHTSLSKGMPMPPLSREEHQLLLPDLPTLQEIWLQTAEALILDRKIVDRSQDIKRNATALLDLIREDGAAEEDEWWYGMAAPESVKPPPAAIEEDPIE